MRKELTVVHVEDLKLLSKYTDELDTKMDEFLYRNKIQLDTEEYIEFGDIIFDLQELVDRLRD